MPKKIVTVVGARPQFVKAAALSREIAKHADLQEVIVHTGQHFDEIMSQVFFDEMEIPKPAYQLAINSLSHGAMTGRMLEKIEEVLLIEKPDMLLVYGDTNSTLAGALAAKKLHIKVGHVEAGLRSFNIQMPEEVNRILTDRISNQLFCPTQTAVNNLMNEGYMHLSDAAIHLTGDVMQDAALYYAAKAEIKATTANQFIGQDFVLCTLHREENTNDLSRLRSIVSALEKINETVKVVLPIHPRTRKIMEANNLAANLTIIDPVGYFDMLTLLKHCSLVMTDSGGLQKEAFFFQKFCITMRDQTEWVELINEQVNTLVGANAEAIQKAFDKYYKKPFTSAANLYGGGEACAKIVAELV